MNARGSLRIFLLAGEASGDAYGAALACALGTEKYKILVERAVMCAHDKKKLLEKKYRVRASASTVRL